MSAISIWAQIVNDFVEHLASLPAFAGCDKYDIQASIGMPQRSIVVAFSWEVSEEQKASIPSQFTSQGMCLLVVVEKPEKYRPLRRITKLAEII